MANQYFIGIDIGGTNVDGLLVMADELTGELTPSAFLSKPIRPSDGATPFPIISELIESLLKEELLIDADQISAIGVGVPGLVDASTGNIELAVNLAEPAMPLGQMLQDRFGVPVAVENDANAVAFGAAHFLADAVENLAFVMIGTGVGAGLILNGEIFHGAKNMAGEIGHMFYQESDVRCQCGAYGCLETFVAGPAIARMAREAVAADPMTRLCDYDHPDAAAVFAEADLGDEAARAIVNQVAVTLARSIQGLMMSFDLELVVIGGGISRAGDSLLTPILNEWHTMRSQSVMAQEMLKPEKLVMSPSDYKAGAWGAVAVGMNRTNHGRELLNQASLPVSLLEVA